MSFVKKISIEHIATMISCSFLDVDCITAIHSNLLAHKLTMRGKMIKGEDRYSFIDDRCESPGRKVGVGIENHVG